MEQNITEYSYIHHGVVEQYIYHSQKLAHMTEVTPIIFSNADPVTKVAEKYQLKYKDIINFLKQKSMLYSPLN
jgi:hypothetical protein